MPTEYVPSTWADLCGVAELLVHLANNEITEETYLNTVIPLTEAVGLSFPPVRSTLTVAQGGDFPTWQHARKATIQALELITGNYYDSVYRNCLSFDIMSIGVTIARNPTIGKPPIIKYTTKNISPRTICAWGLVQTLCAGVKYDTCPNCKKFIVVSSDWGAPRRYCSHVCKQKMQNKRKKWDRYYKAIAKERRRNNNE